METEIESTWKTIVDNATVEDADTTYKTSKITMTSLDELPTVNIETEESQQTQETNIETIDITLATDEIDEMAATVPSYIERSSIKNDSFGEVSNQEKTVKDTVTSFDATADTVVAQNIDLASKPNYLEEDTFVLPLMSGQPINKTRNSFATLKVENEIARGGMGVVLKGQQNSLKREIAIKRLLNENDLVNKKKFVMEARVTAFLDHPNIIPIHELGIDHKGNPLLTMKLVKGKSWKQVLNEKSVEKFCAKHVEEQLHTILQACHALAYSHSKKIIHNDLKPANIMIGEFGEVFVMDWGIAISLDKTENAPTIFRGEIDSPMGTPNYMAPELALGEGNNIGPWTDTYLLGGILYRILMGTPPHQAGNLWGSIRLSSQGNIPPFKEDIPEELVNICRKSLQKNPEDRFRCMEDMQHAIENFLEHWESINITKKAQEFLDFGRGILHQLDVKKRSVKEIRKDIPNLYCPISRALFGFKEALRIWPENPGAIAGEKEGNILYAEIAIWHQDFNLANRVFNDFGPDQEDEKKRLQQKLKEYMAINKKETQGNNTLVFAVIAIAIALVGFLIGRFF